MADYNYYISGSENLSATNGSNAGFVYNGNDDLVIVNIADTAGDPAGSAGDFVMDFSLSDAYDGAVDTLVLNLPTGWTAVVYHTDQNFYPYGDGNGWNYQKTFYIYDDSGNVRGIVDGEFFNMFEINNVCFTRGAEVLCADNVRRPIEVLRAGDLIITKDNGVQPIRWINSTHRSAETLAQFPKLRPIRIKKGALGNYKDMMVSLQHRMLVDKSTGSSPYPGCFEALAPAKGLIDGDQITIAEDIDHVEYFHMLFDRHEVINVDGAWSESFKPGEYSIGAMDVATRNEVITFFPELESDPESYSAPARPLMRVQEVRKALQNA